MSDAPERVFVTLTDGYEHNWWGVVTHELDDDAVEYVRADLLTAAEKRADAAEAENKRLREALEGLLEAHESGWPDKQDWGAGDRARATLAASTEGR